MPFEASITDDRKRGPLIGALAKWRPSRELIGALVTASLILIAWQLLVTSGRIRPFLLPPPAVVFERLGLDLVSATFYQDAWLSIYRALAAFVLAGVIGITTGLLMRANAAIAWFMSPLISILLPLPKVALLPVFMVWFGLFDVSKIALTTFSAVFIVMIATTNAASKVETALIWSARNLGASRWKILRDVILPGALPGILTGLQIALPVCLVVAFLGEMVMGGKGIGGRMIVNVRNFDSPGVFAGIVEISMIGNCLIGLMQIARRRLLYWVPGQDRA